MKLRDLYERLEYVAQLKSDISVAELALRHGGSESTIARKQESLRNAEQRLEDFLDQDIEL